MADEDLNGGAGASVDTAALDTTNQSLPPAEAVRGALDRAFDTVEGLSEADATAQTDVDKPAGTRDRNADGTFKGKDQGQAIVENDQQLDQQQDKGKGTDPKDAPARFASDPEAKAAWASTPDPVKAAVTRTIRELEQGIEKHRGDATIYNNVFKPFVDLAVKSNLDPRAALQGYVDIDIALAQNFGAGLKMIFDRAGADPRQWAQAILGQKQDGGGQQQPDARDRQLAALMNEVQQLRQGFGGISQTLQDQHAQGVGQSLSSYTASLSDGDKALFSELDAEIAAILTSDPAISLPEAFSKAKDEAQGRYQRIFGKPPAPAQTRTPGTGGSDPRKGQLSVSGAPGNGQSAVNRAVPTSPREALDRSFAALGL